MTSRTETNGLRRKRRRALAAAVTGGVILILWMSWLTVRHTTDVSAKDSALSGKTSAVASASAVGSVANQGKALAKNVQQQCRTDAAFRADNPSLCVQASVLATATPTPIPGPTGPAGPGPSDTQVQTAVNIYLKAHPPPIDYMVLQAFVNSYLVAHTAPAGSVGPSGVNGSPGESGLSGANGLPGSKGSDGTNGTSGTTPPDATSVTGIQASQNGGTLTLTFVMSRGDPIIVSVLLPSACPSTATVTPPSPALGDPGNPTTPYAVCVPAE